MKATKAELVALVAGDITVEQLAARHGASVDEVRSWRAAFCEGMRAATAVPSGPRIKARWALAAGVIATAAFAQLTVFSPNTPAVASDVNGNFSQLKAWLEQKVGTAGSSAVNITGALTVANMTSSGQISAPSMTLGGLNAPRSGENLRIIRGTFTLTGATTGSGFSVSGASTTTPTVTFGSAFSATPTVVCSTGPSPVSQDVCSVSVVSSSSFQLIIGDRNIGYFPEPISFIAIGPN